MAEFQEVMRQWARMCNSMPGKDEYLNLCSDKESGYICPMKDSTLCNKALSSQTDDDRLIGERIIMAWAAEHPEPVYPTWGEWFVSRGILPEKWDNLTSAYMNVWCVPNLIHSPIPANIAEKLGLQPKEG